MGLKLGSQELANECWRLQEEKDPKFIEAIAGLNLGLLFVSLDCSGNEDRQLAIVFEDGKFSEILVTIKPAPSDLRTAPFDHTKYDFRVQAPVVVLMEMISGKAKMLDTIAKVKIDGDFGKLMANAQGFSGFIEYLQNLDIEP